MTKLINISELSKILNLVDPETKKPQNYILRYWEKEFKEIKPFIFAGKRRYYDENTIKTLKKIHFLLKNQGMTIKGVKKLLNIKDSQLDETDIKTINKKIIKTKLDKISNLIKDIKNNG